MSLPRPTVAVFIVLSACAGQASQPGPAPATTGSTTAAISPQDLKLRLYTFAADSMLGRETGTLGNVKGTDYIAAEFRRAGLEPAGENGSYFQTVPIAKLSPSDSSSIGVGDVRLASGKDFVAYGMDSTRGLGGVRAVYGGLITDSSTWISSAQAAGHIVVFGLPAGQSDYVRFGFLTEHPRFAGAVAVAAGELQFVPPELIAMARQPTTTLLRGASTAPFQLVLAPGAAAQLLGASPDRLEPGAMGPALTGSVIVQREPPAAPARNVVAVLRGSDPALRGEYVALGAHNDHLGLADRPLDHDSVRMYNRFVRPRGADSPERAPTAAELAAFRQALDSLRKIRPARPDSIYNGADDDGSGTVALLEIAEAFGRSGVRPRRSIIFVSHTGEEEGVFGSQHFTDHPTVPRDSIVAQLNMDMIGRGDAVDLPAGGPSYLAVIGSRRLSTELGDLLERVNTEGHHGFTFDYTLDAPGHPEQVYCRSDHTEYARYGIPIAFVSTDLHEDYHQLTDEPQYIDYTKLARVAQLMHDLALNVANLDHRVVVDKPKPNPKAPCQQ